MYITFLKKYCRWSFMSCMHQMRLLTDTQVATAIKPIYTKVRTPVFYFKLGYVLGPSP